MSLNLKLLEAICQAPGAPGYEQKIRNLILDEVRPLVDEVELDNMGNIGPAVGKVALFSNVIVRHFYYRMCVPSMGIFTIRK